MFHPPPLLVNCSNCRTPLQLPPGVRSIRCALCQAITHIADPRAAPPPAASASHAPDTPRPPPSPSPYNPAPPAAHGRKKAVICGISYKYSRHELKGCINDAKCMKYLLINKFKFPESSILMLTGTITHDSIVLTNIFVLYMCYRYGQIGYIPRDWHGLRFAPLPFWNIFI